MKLRNCLVLIIVTYHLSFLTYAGENMLLTRNNHAELGDPVGPYTHSVVFNNVIYTSGLTAFGTPAIEQGIAAQTREIFKQLSIVLKNENSSLKHLIKVTLFVKDLTQLAEVRETLFELYDGEIPASSAVEVSSLFDSKVHIEIEAVAAVNY